MKMLITRLGKNTKLVITGDLKQSDLGENSGLADIVNKIDGLNLKYIEHVTMENDDILRHPAVSEILKIY